MALRNAEKYALAIAHIALIGTLLVAAHLAIYIFRILTILNTMFTSTTQLYTTRVYKVLSHGAALLRRVVSKRKSKPARRARPGPGYGRMLPTFLNLPVEVQNLVWNIAYNDAFDALFQKDIGDPDFHRRTSITAHLNDTRTGPLKICKVSCLVHQTPVFHVSRHSRSESLYIARNYGDMVLLHSGRSQNNNTEYTQEVFSPFDTILQIRIPSAFTLPSDLQRVTDLLATDPLIARFHAKIRTLHFIVGKSYTPKSCPCNPLGRCPATRNGPERQLVGSLIARLSCEWNVRWLSIGTKGLSEVRDVEEVCGGEDRSGGVPVKSGCARRGAGMRGLLGF